MLRILKKSPTLKFVVIGCGTMAILIAALIAWVGVSLFSGPDLMEMSAYHPYRAAETGECACGGVFEATG